MNYLNICLKLPNIGLVTFYLIFILLIPMVIINFSAINNLQYYFPILVAFANVLTLSGSPYIFQNLYSLNPKNIVSTMSTWIINLIALSGIIWQTLEYSKYELRVNRDPNISILYGLVLMGITFVVSTIGIKALLDQVDKWQNKNKKQVKGEQINNNWNKFIFGAIAIIMIVGLETILVGLLNDVNPGLIRNVRVPESSSKA